jgi:hypothetical protein
MPHLRRPRTWLLVVLILLLVAGTLQAADRGPSTKEERDQAVALVHLLETDPLSAKAKEARAWLTIWLAEIPDITVTLCSNLLGPGFDSDKKYGPELMVQLAYSAAAFGIEHPDQASNPLAVDTAAVQGVLRTYQALLEAKPKARFKALDELLEVDKAGQLSARLAGPSKACRK